MRLRYNVQHYRKGGGEEGGGGRRRKGKQEKKGASGGVQREAQIAHVEESKPLGKLKLKAFCYFSKGQPMYRSSSVSYGALVAVNLEKEMSAWFFETWSLCSLDVLELTL